MTAAATDKRTRSVRLSQAGWQRIAERAASADVDVSRMMRRMLAYADAHMPDGWVPPRRERAETQRTGART